MMIRMPSTDLRGALWSSFSPDRTRRPTAFERRTVCRLRWERLLALNRWLEIFGRVTTGLWVAFMVSLVLGVDWKDAIESAINSGRPVRAAVVLVVIIPTLLFAAARSVIGFARWRVQRELWRREVEQLER